MLDKFKMTMNVSDIMMTFFMAQCLKECFHIHYIKTMTVESNETTYFKM